MYFSKIKVTNRNKELLDVWIEGNNKSNKTIVLVHGLAVDKHETAKYFDDISNSLKEAFRVVRFDFSGCGESEGSLEEKDYLKWSDDLIVIIDYVKNNFKGDVYILAQSMGCFITAISNPDGIVKTVFTGIPNNNTQFIIDRITKRFSSRAGSIVDYQGISIFPRSSGEVQKIGPSFWRVLKNFKPYETVAEFTKKTKLLIIHPLQDNIVGSEYLEEYSTIPGVEVKKIDGDHSFAKIEDRKVLMTVVKNFLK